jgi:hypothetical protein
MKHNRYESLSEQGNNHHIQHNHCLEEWSAGDPHKGYKTNMYGRLDKVREIWDEGNRTLVKALRTQEGMSGK